MRASGVTMTTWITRFIAFLMRMDVNAECRAFDNRSAGVSSPLSLFPSHGTQFCRAVRIKREIEKRLTGRTFSPVFFDNVVHVVQDCTYLIRVYERGAAFGTLLFACVSSPITGVSTYDLRLSSR